MDVIIKADGTAVKNVYYDRNTYSIRFYQFQSWGYLSGEYTNLKITAKFGEDISARWAKALKTCNMWENPDTGDYYSGFSQCHRKI